MSSLSTSSTARRQPPYHRRGRCVPCTAMERNRRCSALRRQVLLTWPGGPWPESSPCATTPARSRRGVDALSGFRRLAHRRSVGPTTGTRPCACSGNCLRSTTSLRTAPEQKAAWWRNSRGTGAALPLSATGSTTRGLFGPWSCACQGAGPRQEAAQVHLLREDLLTLDTAREVDVRTRHHPAPVSLDHRFNNPDHAPGHHGPPPVGRRSSTQHHRHPRLASMAAP